MFNFKRNKELINEVNYLRNKIDNLKSIIQEICKHEKIVRPNYAFGSFNYNICSICRKTIWYKDFKEANMALLKQQEENLTNELAKTKQEIKKAPYLEFEK